MKRHVIRLLSASALLLSFSTYAHDPSEHMTEGQQPDCSTLDDSKKNMSDPVMQAMIKKCATDMHGDSKHPAKDAITRNIPKSEAK